VFRCCALKCGCVGIFSGEFFSVCGLLGSRVSFKPKNRALHHGRAFEGMDLQFFEGMAFVLGQDYTATLHFLVSFLYIASEYMN